MKDIITVGLVTIATLFALGAAAQEPDDGAYRTPEDSEMYQDEIRVACEAEAIGLPDAQEYVAQCIKAMTQGFAGEQD